MLNEVIVHPRPQRFRDDLRNDSTHLLVQTLDLQSSRDRADFEVLFGAGQIAREEGVTGVDDLVARWLRESVLPRRWDVGACFLMGYWAEPVEPGDDLVALLLQQLGQMDSGAAGWNEMARALAAAVILSTNSAAIARIRGALRSAVARADPSCIQPGTAAILEDVLET